MDKALTLLYLEDDISARTHYVKGFELLFSKIYETGSVKEASRLYDEHNPDMILVDISLEDGDGLVWIKEIRQEDETTPIIVISAHSDREKLLEAIELKLFKYLVKPVKSSVLCETINLVKKQLSILGKTPIYLSTELSWCQDEFSLNYLGEKIKLSKNENCLVALLLQDRNKIVTISEIEEYVYPQEGEVSTQAIKNLVNRLRKKVPLTFIKNHYSIGFQIITDS